MSRGQVVPLLSLSSSATKVWKSFCGDVKPEGTLDDVFGATCRVFDEPDNYSLDMFRDEFIGQLLKALPHTSLNYDRWLIELDPKEQKRREQFGDPPPTPSLTPIPDRGNGKERPDAPPVTLLPPDETRTPVLTGLCSGTLTTASWPEPAPEIPPGVLLPASSEVNAGSIPRQEIQPDLYGGNPVISGDTTNDAAPHSAFVSDDLISAFDEEDVPEKQPVSSVAFAATGLEPVTDIWHIPALQDDIEHLQDMAYRLAFEIAEAMGCQDYVSEDKHLQSAGFVVSDSASEFGLLLAGLSGHLPNKPFNMFMFCLNFFGTQEPADTAVFDDITVVKTMRLIRVIRRLRALQRLAANGGEHV